MTMWTNTRGVLASLGFGSERRPGLQLIDGHHQAIWSAVEQRFRTSQGTGGMSGSRDLTRTASSSSYLIAGAPSGLLHQFVTHFVLRACLSANSLGAVTAVVRAFDTGARSHMVEWTSESGKLRSRLRVSHRCVASARRPAAPPRVSPP